jgi:putative redox protein
MVQIDVRYAGQLRCELAHGPSGSTISTDAPADNQGKAERFSPTDLVAAALGSCILTTMGIVAQRKGIALEGATARVIKEMADGPRRIQRLEATITMPAGLTAPQRELLERAGRTCPVHHSLRADIDAPITFVYA